MKLYRLLSGINALKSYSSKFMFVAFLGIHIPLLGIVGVLIATTGDEIKKTSFFLITLGLTLLATVITLAILHSLIAPLRHTQKQLAAYLAAKNLPDIPTNYTDETGLLMRDIQTLISSQQELKESLQKQSAEILAAVNAVNHLNPPESVIIHNKNIATAVNKQLLLINHLDGTANQ